MRPARPSPNERGEPVRANLRDREKEILQLVAKGMTHHEISQYLGISRFTVCNHCTNIREKVGANSKVALAAYAFRSGLVE